MPNRKMSQVIEGHPFITVGPETTIRDATIQMAENAIGAVAVLEGKDTLVGIFTERDLIVRVVAPGADPETVQIKEVMSENPQTVLLADTVRRALGLMKMNNLRHLVVMDADRPVGMVSMRDFVGRELEDLDRQAEFESQVWERAG